MRKVAIVLELDSDEQAHHLEIYLREKMFVGKVISYRNLPDTSKLYEDSTTFRKLVKAEKLAKREKNDYINENN